MDKPKMSPEAAAKIAGCTRPTIMVAIKEGKLVAKRSNSGNRWEIAQEELDIWIASRSKPPTKPTNETEESSETYTEDRNILLIENRRLTEENSNLHSKISGLEAEVKAANEWRLAEQVRAKDAEDRERVNSQASLAFAQKIALERLQAQQTQAPQVQPEQGRGLLARLFGKR